MVTQIDSRSGRQIQNRTYSEKTDSELVEICDSGDGDAFGELARRYRPLAFRTAFFVLKNEEDAEDQVQNALCKAFEHIRQYRRDARFSTWLVRIVVNECLMQLRRARHATLVSIDALGHQGPLELRDEKRSPELEFEGVQMAETLHKEVRRIPALLRNVFLLYEVQQKPISEVARALGISQTAAKSRLFRARIELRKRLHSQLFVQKNNSDSQARQ